ncbi:MAG: RES domain-containing protein [Candidatus Delongbacteria bacterium]|nr:RES domain-containing protein [Candidatus Delongbacteria bacterium]
MYCCSNCFNDNFLKEHIELKSTQNGDCSFCGSKDVKVINPEHLYDLFIPVFDLYKSSTRGATLGFRIKKDWNIFNIEDIEKLYSLMSLLYDSELLESDKFKPIYKQDKSNIAKWMTFKEELKHENRFFPRNRPKDDHLEYLFKYLGVKEHKDKIFYRARKDTGSKHSKDLMKKPSSKKATNGRANPNGISYLYLASDVNTAISKIRPYKDETITISEFVPIEDLSFADLRQPQSFFS